MFQLFMIEPIRTGILGVEGAADDIEEDYSAMEKGEGEVTSEIIFIGFRQSLSMCAICQDLFFQLKVKF